MKRTATLVLGALFLLVGSALASPRGASIEGLLRAIPGTVKVPAEWDGVWVEVDSVYDCNGALQSTSAPTDTICGGQVFDQAVPGFSIVFDCNGTEDATSFDIICTGISNVSTDCDASFTVHAHGTRSGDTFFTVSRIDVEYLGAGCYGLPPLCRQVNSHGTRTGPAPADYCLTPTKPSTWGRLKTLYR